ncbi:hypothetical protein CGSSp9BS68_03803, partial [Streptococcus pneumoniae SP9-BS68]
QDGLVLILWAKEGKVSQDASEQYFS